MGAQGPAGAADAQRCHRPTGSWQTALWKQIWFNLVKRYEVDLTHEERAAADAWINERYFFLVHEANRPTLEWFLEIAEVAIIRHAARASVTTSMYCVVCARFISSRPT